MATILERQQLLDQAMKIADAIEATGVSRSVAEAQAFKTLNIDNSGSRPGNTDNPSGSDDAAAAAKLEQQKQIDTLTAQILAANVSARSALLKLVGQSEADRIAKTLGLNGIADFKNKPTSAANALELEQRKTNPWSKAGWSLAKQGELIKKFPLEKVSEIAASVKSHIGATHPVM